ncbi:hypothetical protein IMSAGC009_02256 [Lachnospiraceae bacterium]|nr:hypothetical protein IMSAGC009_02256 [Lachnospiraceae bacterium]
MNTKKSILSLIGGVYISLVFYISIIFPPLASDMPLAAFDAWPQTTVALFLYHVRVALDAGYGISQSITALLIALFLYNTLDQLKKSSYLYKKSLIVLSMIFGCVNVLGLCMYWLDCIPMFFSIIWLIGSLMLIFGWACVFLILACLFFEALDKDCLCIKHDNVCLPWTMRWTEKHLFWGCFFIILFAWLPWIISYYPASMDNDVFNQLYSWMYEPNNHHPWFSTCILGICFNIGSSIGNDNLGIFIYVMCRDVILALIYAKCVELQKEFGLKRGVYYATLLFYAITPVWGAYAKHAFKDTFSTGLFCLYIISLILAIQQVKNGILKNQTCFLYGGSSLLVSLFRNNCIFAVFPITLMLVVYLIKKKQAIYKITVIVFCVITYFVYNYYVVNYQNVIPGSKVEALSIPFQQTARTVRDHGNELSEEEKNDINKVLQYNELAEVYDPILSDNVKWRAKLGGDNDISILSGYFKIWFQLLLRYPATYVEAAIGQSYGYYAFTPNLPEGAGFWNSGMTIFDALGCAGGFDDNFEFHYTDKLGEIRQVLHMWAKVWDKIPIICLTDICAFYTWSIVMLFYYLISKRRFWMLLPFIAIGIIILTCIASPVNDCFRYFSPVAASYPALYVLVQNNKSMAIEQDSLKNNA